MADIVLETERLVLRRLDEGDAVLHDKILNTPNVMKHLGGVKELHELEAKHAKGMAQFAREGFSFMMLIEKSSGDLVGHAGMKRVDNENAKNQGDHEIGGMASAEWSFRSGLSWWDEKLRTKQGAKGLAGRSGSDHGSD